ncbi:MAG: chemotaxis protein CheW [Pseudobdellovibrio sp.]
MTNENELRFLIYKIGTETYGSPLLSVREVLEFQKPKFMPNMIKSFSGVINVRGAIVGVVDMRTKFGFPEDIQRKTSMLLCDTERGPIAAVVDNIECVLEIKSENMEKEPPIRSKVPASYLMGVAKNNDQLITIIDLQKALTEEEFKLAV